MLITGITAILPLVADFECACDGALFLHSFCAFHGSRHLLVPRVLVLLSGTIQVWQLPDLCGAFGSWYYRTRANAACILCRPVTLLCLKLLLSLYNMLCPSSDSLCLGAVLPVARVCSSLFLARSLSLSLPSLSWNDMDIAAGAVLPRR